jgi:hypothetical protein
MSTAFAVAAALANPYGAFHRTQPFQRQLTTLDGYTISSAYTPSLNPSSSSGRDRAIEPNNRQRTINTQSPAW